MSYQAKNKCLGSKPDYQANSALRTNQVKEEAEQRAQDDIASKISSSFGALASAAVAKAETIDSHAATILLLTKTNSELVATNNYLAV